MIEEPGRLRIVVAVMSVAGALSAVSPARAATSPVRAAHVTIGVLAFRSKPQTELAWRPLAEALDASVPGCTFEIAALSYPELDWAVVTKTVDLVITNPGHYVAIKSREPMSSVLATVVEAGPDGSVSGMGGTIIVRSDRPDLVKLADLVRGARIAAVGPDSLGGYQAQVYEMVKSGLVPPDARRIRFTGMPHDQVMELVLAGDADAGFLRAGLIERMAREGRLDRRRITVLNPKRTPEFPYAASTRLYPGWPVVALSHLDETLARRVAAALLLLDRAAPPPRGAAYSRFTIPADYGQVEAVLRELRFAPFDGPPSFHLDDVARRYRKPLTALAVAVAAIVVLSLFLASSHRRLRIAHDGRMEVVAQLRATLQEVKTLKGLLPICMHCHKIRSDEGYWHRIDQYITDRTEAIVTHALCPACAEEHYSVTISDVPDDGEPGPEGGPGSTSS